MIKDSQWKHCGYQRAQVLERQLVLAKRFTLALNHTLITDMESAQHPQVTLGLVATLVLEGYSHTLFMCAFLVVTTLLLFLY